MYENKSRKELIDELHSAKNQLIQFKEKYEQLEEKSKLFEHTYTDDKNTNDIESLDELRTATTALLSDLEKQKKVYTDIINDVRVLRSELLQSFKEFTGIIEKINSTMNVKEN